MSGVFQFAFISKLFANGLTFNGFQFASVNYHTANLKKKGATIMKTTATATATENGGGFNFKKAFIIFFVALFAFLAIYTLYQMGSGQWETAVDYQNRRFEARSSGDLFTMLELRISRGLNRAFTRNPSDRILYGFAEVVTRFNKEPSFVFGIFVILFLITFVVLVISWVFVRVRNRINRTPQH